MLATAQFWCADQLSKALVTTRAPSLSAIARVPSVLIESKTTISSHQESDSRHSPILISSLSVRIRTETLTPPHSCASRHRRIARLPYPVNSFGIVTNDAMSTSLLFAHPRVIAWRNRLRRNSLLRSVYGSLAGRGDYEARFSRELLVAVRSGDTV